MTRAIKIFHFGGLIIFLGSIITFVVISAIIEGSGLENIIFGRKIIAVGTNILTFPGMWILAVSGIWMGLRHYGIKNRFFQIKLLIIVIIIINAHFLVAPAVSETTGLAINSLVHGYILPAYKSAYMQESIFGGINVLLALTAIITGVWKIGGKSKIENK